MYVIYFIYLCIIYTHTCFLYNKSLIVGFHKKLHITWDHLILQNSTWLNWPVLKSLTHPHFLAGQSLVQSIFIHYLPHTTLIPSNSSYTKSLGIFNSLMTREAFFKFLLQWLEPRLLNIIYSEKVEHEFIYKLQCTKIKSISSYFGGFK